MATSSENLGANREMKRGLHTPVGLMVLIMALLTGCVAEGDYEQSLLQDELRQCATGGTVDGIDVSVWQGSINWTSVRNDGVEFAFIRVGDGLTFDRQFDRNWAESRRVGVLRGAYHFFRPGRDPIAQADFFVDHIGDLADNDLPPVLDLEDTDGVARATVLSRAQAWLARVEERTGRRPIIYSGYYFWRDELGNPSWGSSYPLWIPQYGRTCPTINAPPWQRWDFWQTSSTGRVAGISGAVDLNFFQGSRSDLERFISRSFLGGPPATGETPIDMPVVEMPAPTCTPIAAEGGVVEDGSACFTTFGPATGWRTTADGSGGLHWTYAVSSTRTNYARWALPIAAAGRYDVEVFIDTRIAQSRTALYTVVAGGAMQAVRLDQSAASGWRRLGSFDFRAGAGQYLDLGDATGELYANRVRVAFDAVRLTPSSTTTTPTPSTGVPTAAEVLAALGGCSRIGGSYASDAGGTSNINVCSGAQGIVHFAADMDIDCDGGQGAECRADPYYQSTTAAVDSRGRYLDASSLPFIVLPLSSSRWNFRNSNIRYGTVAAVIYEGRLAIGIVGDAGPASIIGEASAAMAAELGVSGHPIRGGVGSGVTYVVFPGTNVTRNEDHDEAVRLATARLQQLVGR